MSENLPTALPVEPSVELPAAAPSEIIVEQNGIPSKVTPIEMASQAKPGQPEPNAYDLLPEKTKQEMRAGATAIGTTFNEELSRRKVIEDGGGVFRNRSMDLYKSNFGKATQSIVDVDAYYDHDKGTWMTRVTVIGVGAGAEPVVMQEPFSQFPSDEMKTWVGITVT